MAGLDLRIWRIIQEGRDKKTKNPNAGQTRKINKYIVKMSKIECLPENYMLKFDKQLPGKEPLFRFTMFYNKSGGKK